MLNMAWIDRPRHAEMRSLLPRLPKRSMEAHHAHPTRDRRSDFGGIAVSETRKLVAILVADIVGYSGLRGRTRIEFSLGSAPFGAT